MKAFISGLLLITIGGCFPILTGFMVACVIKHEEIRHSFLGV